MSYRIVYTPSARLKGGSGGDVTPPVESYELGPKIRAAVAAGVFTALAAIVIFGFIAWLLVTIGGAIGFVTPLKTKILLAVGVAALSIIVGLLIMCWFGYEWSVKAATRPWVVDDTVRARIWGIEDEERKVAKQAIENAKEGSPDSKGAPTASGDRLHTVAMNVLMRHYLGGQLTTRDAMATVEKVCTQPEWNIVNQAMKAIDLKRKNKLRDDMDFAMAAEMWWANVDIREDGYLWVQNARGQWKALVEIA